MLVAAALCQQKLALRSAWYLDYYNWSIWPI